jgi:formamidopyrimidine-DNA glycosylase
MPELAEVDYFRARWNPGLKQRIEKVLLHDKKRLFRGIDTTQMAKALTGATLERSEARGKQMLFVARKVKAKNRSWIGIHLGMTGELRLEKPGFTAAKHDHLVLLQAKHALVFQDASFSRKVPTRRNGGPNSRRISSPPRSPGRNSTRF